MCSWAHYNVSWNGPLVTACNRWGSLSGVSDVQVLRGATLWRRVTSGRIGLPMASLSTLEEERHSVVRLNAMRLYYAPAFRSADRLCHLIGRAAMTCLSDSRWICYKTKTYGRVLWRVSKTNCKFQSAFGGKTICGPLILLIESVWIEIVYNLT